MKEVKILVITGILPVSAIEYKKTENDILLVTEDEIKKRHKNISFQYIFTFPYANKLLAIISLKWKTYYKLKKRSFFVSCFFIAEKSFF